uniref:Regulator of G-protein signaling 7 n=1 Tax=Cacopsylla melanoneura TaxID=428564 RepID=A0A8D8WIG5_9HEMI
MDAPPAADPAQAQARGHRPLAFDKMEGLVQEMQDPHSKRGVPVKSQKQYFTPSYPSVFTGCDLVDWLMDRLCLKPTERDEAVQVANQLCQFGYFFPVNDTKNLVFKDSKDTHYIFQIPYYWPWQHRQSPDNVEYAIYLEKRSLRNKQRHGLEEYELEALNNLKRNLANKWDLISMQAEEQVRLSKDRKKVDKIVADSQERAYWRVHRPPPGFTSSLEPIPTCMRGGTGHRKKRSVEDLKKELDFLKSCLDKTRTKTSLVVESLVLFSETYSEYDAFFTTPNPSNPWNNDDTQYWLLNSPLVEVPTERRVRRWALSIEDLIKDPTGLAEFTTYLRKEYSHENIRFWLMVNELRHSSQSKIATKVKDIFDEFLAPGAPCEINIDGRTMERTQTELKAPSRFTYDAAAEHVYTLLLKNDCYPRFVRSDHYKTLLQAGKQPCTKKRFPFPFGGGQKKKTSSTATPSTSVGLSGTSSNLSCTVPSTSSMGVSPIPPSKEIATRALRRGSDRSLTDGAHELAVSTRHVAHSHSQSNLSDINYPRDTTKIQGGSSTEETNQDDVCPWDDSPILPPSRPASIVHQPSGPQLVTATSLVGPHAYSLKRFANTTMSTSVTDEIWEHHQQGGGAIGGQASGLGSGAQSRTNSRKNSNQLDSNSSSSDVSMAVAHAGSLDISDRLNRINIERRLSCTVPVARSSVSSNEEGQQTAQLQRSFEGDLATPGSPKLPTTSPSGGTSYLESERKRSLTTPTQQTPLRKHSTASTAGTAPLISVSSVAENVPLDEETAQGQSETAQASSSGVSGETGEDITGAVATGSQAEGEAKNTEVCPWEDEESCKVNTPFVKKYATLGYL